MIDDLLDEAAALPPEVVGAIGAAAAFLLVLAVSVQLAVLGLRRELDAAAEELVDEETGLLPRSALRVRLGAELAWAAASHVPLAVAVLRIRGSRFTHAATVLRHAMREEESAFLLGDQHVAVELWGVDPPAAVAATRRLGEDLVAAGHPVVDAGIACSPRDGEDVETLLTVARRDLRPIDDPNRHEDEVPAARVSVRGRLGHAVWVLAASLPGFVAVAALALLAWRLVPAAIEPVLDGGARSSSELAVALVALLGLPLGAALLHATCWALGTGRLPTSRPASQWGIVPALTVIAIVGAPLAWGIFGSVPAELTTSFGATLAVLALLVLAMLHARQLVHAPIVGLVPVAAVGAAITWLAVQTSDLPVVANAGRLLLAAALGALLARLVERASWIVFLALLAAAIDVWSVHAETGVTRRILESGSDDAGRLLDLLLFTGPAIGTIAPFVLGVTDLVFLALFIAWSHDWRLDLRIVAMAMVAACWAGALTAELVDEVLPLLPFLSGAIVLVVLGRSVLLRTRAAAWRPTRDR